MGVELDWGEADKQMAKSGGGGRSRRFQIKDGETVAIRFIGGAGEPYIWKRHFIKQGKSGVYMVCAEKAQRDGDHEGCVPCFVAKMSRGNKLKPAQPVASFSILDPRKFHMLDEEYKGSKFHLCEDTEDDGDCRFCRKGNKAKPQGRRHWTVSKKVFEQIRDFAKRLAGRCATCGVGKITVTGYSCPECGTAMDPDDPNEEQKCFECSGKKSVFVMPLEQVACSKGCKKPRKARLQDAWINLTRTGDRTDTSFNFERGDIEPIPEDYASEKPFDFSKEADFEPESASEQAATMGIRNPFSAKGKYDDEDEDDDEPKKRKAKDPWDDDDDEPPRKKKRKLADDEDDEPPF